MTLATERDADTVQRRARAVRIPRARPVCILHVAFCITCLLTTACGARRISLPTDPGAPLPNFTDIHTKLSSSCRGARTLTAELGLSGRAGNQRLRGRLLAGFERPASMRLEGVAPFGQPVFILASRTDAAVLLLPRDERVVTGEPPAAILGALTGVALAPADLQALLTGCVVPEPKALAGRMHANGWASIELGGGATLYLERDGEWQVRAAQRDRWQVEYPAWQGAFPQTIRLASSSADVDVDLTATMSQIEVNVDLDPSAFSVSVPPGARPLSLDELRNAGPLGEKP
jgi:outer membrane biogenesis lipoprotein LolB